tara:strand:+ start:29740 stop:31023 length:1284 start_codon:yes stop_codon:yes gene_type:complete
MKPLKDAHCTETLAQRPPTDPRDIRRSNSSPIVLWLLACALCLCVLSLPALAQTAVTEKTDETASETKDSDAEANATQAPSSDAPPEPPPYASREERDMNLLAARLEGETAVWLQALEQPFLALYEQELTGDAVGAVLIINAEGQHSNWPTTSEQIRLSLPEFGWNTLSTELPLPEQRPIPQRSAPIAPAPPSVENPDPTATDATAESNQDPASSVQDTPPTKAEKGEDKEIYDSTTGELSDGSLPPSAENPTAPGDADTPVPELKVPAEDIAIARLEAAISYLHQQGQFNIVLMGSGVGALRAVCFLKDIPKVEQTTQSRLIRSLVMINARNHLPLDSRQLHQCLDTPEMPVLDVYLGHNERDQKDAKQRLKYARRSGYQIYQQLRLPEMAHNTMLGENRLSRRVRGFMEAHAQGVKVDNAVINNP